MSSVPPSDLASPVTAEPRRSLRWTSVAGGCALGCLGITVLIVAGVIGLVRWGTRASPVPDVAAFLTPDAHAYASISVDAVDPGTVALLDALSAARDGQEDLQLRKAAPLRLTVLAVGDPPGFVAAVSVSRYMNWLRLSFLPAYYLGDTKVTRYRGSRLLVGSDGPGAMTIALGSLIAGSDPDVAKYAVDRLEDADGGLAAPDLAPLWAESVGAPVRLAAANRDGSLLKILDWILARTKHTMAAESALPDLLRRSRGLTLEAQLGAPSANQITGHVDIHIPGATAGDLDSLGGLVPWLQETLKSDKATLTASVRQDGDRLVLDFRFDLNLLEIETDKWKWKVGPVEVEGS